MGYEVSRLAGGSNGPSNLAGGHRQSIDQHPRAMADVLMLASLAPAWLSGFGRGFPLQDLHTRLFIAADDQATLVIGLKRFGVEMADVTSLGCKVLIVAIEPI